MPTSDPPAYPPYSYVPGKFPHPITDPAGHSYGLETKPTTALDPDRWRECHGYLHGLELLNGGYYWEAHEAWESAWLACGRKGTAADFLKALIKLAAALVKAREGRVGGVSRHGARAIELLNAIQSDSASKKYAGLSLDELRECAQQLAMNPQTFVNDSDQPVVKLLTKKLTPDDKTT